MSVTTINIGLVPNDRRGDPLRTAFAKTNNNFTFLADSKETRVGVVATRGQVPINVENLNQSNTVVESQTIWTTAGQPVSELQVAFANWTALSGGDVTTSLSYYTLSAAILKPPFGTAIPLTFQGQRNPNVAVGTTIILSDPLPMEVVANTQIAIRCAATVPVGGGVAGGMKIMQTNDRMWSSPASNTQVYTNTSMTVPAGGSQSTFGFMPMMLVGKTEIPQLRIGILGDSIAYGQNDSHDGNGNSGFITRGLWQVKNGNSIPYVNMSRSGATFASVVGAQAAYRRVGYRYVSHVICELGTNDIAAGDDLETIQENALLIWGGARRAGCKIYQTLITPKTTGSNNLVIADGFEPDGIRDQFNDWVVDCVEDGTLDGYINPNIHLESNTSHGLWANSSYTYDGLHLHANGAIAAASVVAAWVNSL